MTDTSATVESTDPYVFDTPHPSDAEFFGFLSSNAVTPDMEPQDISPAARGRYQAMNVWAFDDLGYDLTVEEQLFVRSYIIDRNEIAALRRLGYVEQDRGQLKRIAHRFLRATQVQDAIRGVAKQMMDKLEISAERVNKHIASIAFTDVTDVVKFDGVQTEIIPSHLWPKHARVAMKSVKNGQFGLQIEFHDKHKALDFLAKQTGLDASEKDSALAQAEAAAEMAIGKILNVVARSQEIKLAKLSAPESDVIEQPSK